jgi:hypothetical protein
VHSRLVNIFPFLLKCFWDQICEIRLKVEIAIKKIKNYNLLGIGLIFTDLIQAGR